MQFSQLLLIGAAAVITVSAGPIEGNLLEARADGCFTAGPVPNPPKPGGFNGIGPACRFLQGGYVGGERRSFCVDAADRPGVKWDYTVVNVAKGGDLTFEACYSGLSKEINRCSIGGRKTYKNWQYTYVYLDL